MPSRESRLKYLEGRDFGDRKIYSCEKKFLFKKENLGIEKDGVKRFVEKPLDNRKVGGTERPA